MAVGCSFFLFWKVLCVTFSHCNRLRFDTKNTPPFEVWWQFGSNLLLGAFVLMLLLMTMIMMEVTTVITELWPLTDRLSCARLYDLHYVSLDSSPFFTAGHTTPFYR